MSEPTPTDADREAAKAWYASTYGNFGFDAILLENAYAHGLAAGRAAERERCEKAAAEFDGLVNDHAGEWDRAVVWTTRRILHAIRWGGPPS